MGSFLIRNSFLTKLFTKLLRNKLLYRNSFSKSLRFLRGKNFVIKNVANENFNAAFDVQPLYSLKLDSLKL